MTRSITDFQIRTVSGEIHLHSIEELGELAQFIETHSLYHIAKVSFYIKEPGYATENVILRNRGEYFVPEFCTSSVECGLVEDDWGLVLETLRHDNLDNLFIPWIWRQNI